MKENKETEVKKDVKSTEKKEAKTKKEGATKSTSKKAATSKKSSTTKKAKDSTTKKAATAPKSTAKKSTATRKSTGTTTKKKVEKVVEPVEKVEAAPVEKVEVESVKQAEKEKTLLDEREVMQLQAEIEMAEKELQAEINAADKELQVLEEELKEEIKIEVKPKDKSKEVKSEEVKEGIKQEKPVEESKRKFEPVKKVETKKKKHRFLKTILFLIIVALILFLINYARNYVVISNLTEKQAELAKSTNYSFVTEHYSADDVNDKSIIEHYYKDGKNMMIRDQGNKVIIWNDTETRETIILTPQNLKATIQKDNEMLGNSFPNSIREGSIEPALSFMFLISSEEINGQECYKIVWSLDGATMWVNKENGMLVKSMNGYRVIDGKQYESVTEWKNLKLDELTDVDMSRPNLMGYEVIENY